MVTVTAVILTLSAASPPDKSPEPVQPLTEYAHRLKDPDREKRLKAVEAIQKHYRGKSLDALPR